MTNLRQLLEQDDPIRREGDMSPQAASRMRAQLLSVQSQSQTTTPRLTVVLATGLIVAVVASGWLVRPDAPIAEEVVSAPALRQLQISTPGGTRVIWTFNSNLDVR